MAKQLNMIKNSLSLLGLLFLISCSNNTSNTVTFIEVPAGENSSEPSLHVSDEGIIYLNWLETNGNESSLFFSKLENHEWASPKLIATGEDWFVNWADFPSLTAFGKNNLVSHFLDKSAPDTFAYDVKLTVSNDNGNSWSSPVLAHFDGTHTEHGFASKIALSDDTFMAVWLDGRQNHYAEIDSSITAQMTLRSGIFDKTGKIIEEHLIDDRVCDCCQTDLAMTSKGPIVVYRNRSDKELRDTYYSRFINGDWSEVQAVYNDNWEIEGCPVNGPAISVRENIVAVTWFTIANNIPIVKMSFSTDYGKTFGDPIIIDNTQPIGRLDLELIDTENAIISWMDSIEGKTTIMLQRINLDGDYSKALQITESSESRSSGFPRMTIKDNFAYLAWTVVGDQLNIRTARIAIDNL